LALVAAAGFSLCCCRVGAVTGLALLLGWRLPLLSGFHCAVTELTLLQLLSLLLGWHFC
jgi:hypothetical protein